MRECIHQTPNNVQCLSRGHPLRPKTPNTNTTTNMALPTSQHISTSFTSPTFTITHKSPTCNPVTHPLPLPSNNHPATPITNTPCAPRNTPIGPVPMTDLPKKQNTTVTSRITTEASYTSTHRLAHIPTFTLLITVLMHPPSRTIPSATPRSQHPHNPAALQPQSAEAQSQR